MEITKLMLKNFRNYDFVESTFNSGLNVLVGKNASGKTNMLESIYLAGLGRSPRTSKDKDLIKCDKNRAFVSLEVQKKYRKHRIDIQIDENGKKKVFLDGLAILRTGELIGILNIVYFSPDEMKLVKESPEHRRRFLDISLSQQQKSYFVVLSRYNKALKQRNNFLKTCYNNQNADLMLDVWDEQLAENGAYLIEKRIEYVNKLQKYAKNFHFSMSQGNEQLELCYESNINIFNTEKKIIDKNTKKDNLTADNVSKKIINENGISNKEIFDYQNSNSNESDALKSNGSENAISYESEVTKSNESENKDASSTNCSQYEKNKMSVNESSQNIEGQNLEEKIEKLELNSISKCNQLENEKSNIKNIKSQSDCSIKKIENISCENNQNNDILFVKNKNEEKLVVKNNEQRLVYKNNEISKKNNEQLAIQNKENETLSAIENAEKKEKEAKVLAEKRHQNFEKTIQNIDFSEKTKYLSFQNLKNELKNKFLQNREKDKKLSYTTVGPHRDDIKISINNTDVRKFASQGQQRTTALAIKLGETEMFFEETKEYPILILDDVLSELDEKRKEILLQSIENAQKMISCTEFEKKKKEKIIEISNGSIIQ